MKTNRIIVGNSHTGSIALAMSGALVVALIVACCAACDSPQEKMTQAQADLKKQDTKLYGESQARLPANAYNVIDKGNGWLTFELDDDTFLFSYGGMYRRGWESLTCLTCCKEND